MVLMVLEPKSWEWQVAMLPHPVEESSIIRREWNQNTKKSRSTKPQVRILLVLKSRHLDLHSCAFHSCLRWSNVLTLNWFLPHLNHIEFWQTKGSQQRGMTRTELNGNSSCHEGDELDRGGRASKEADAVSQGVMRGLGQNWQFQCGEERDGRWFIFSKAESADMVFDEPWRVKEERGWGWMLGPQEDG